MNAIETEPPLMAPEMYGLSASTTGRSGSIASPYTPIPVMAHMHPRSARVGRPRHGHAGLSHHGFSSVAVSATVPSTASSSARWSSGRSGSAGWLVTRASLPAHRRAPPSGAGPLERGDRAVQVAAGVGGRHLGADPRLAA